MIYKMKYLLWFLQTSKLSDALYKFWKLLFLDNHRNVSVEYSILWLLLLFDENMVFNLIATLGIIAFKSTSCTRRIRFHQWYGLFTLICYFYRCLKSLFFGDCYPEILSPIDFRKALGFPSPPPPSPKYPQKKLSLFQWHIFGCNSFSSLARLSGYTSLGCVKAVIWNLNTVY